MNARIVFDLDGTLIDSARDIHAMANATLATIGAAPISMEECQTFVGNGIGVFVEKMRHARDIPESQHAALLADMTERYHSAVNLTVAYPSVDAALETLGRAHRLGICTNKLHGPCMAVLKHLDLTRHFASIWGGDNPLGRKPDPAPLHAVFDELGDGPRIYVGDSEVDAATAVRANVPFVLFTPGYRQSAIEDIPHTAAFDDFANLPRLLEELLAEGVGQ